MSDQINPARRSLITGAGLAAAAAALPAKGAEAPMVMEAPSVKIGLEHVFDIRLDFGMRWFGEPMPDGGRQAYTPINERGGLIRGPRLNGKVLPLSGADYPHMRADGIMEFDAHYLLEADDGARIYIHNTGYGSRTTGLRLTPRFRAPKGPHEWLNSTIIVGSGEPRKEPVDHSIFSYYAVT